MRRQLRIRYIEPGFQPYIASGRVYTDVCGVIRQIAGLARHSTCLNVLSTYQAWISCLPCHLQLCLEALDKRTMSLPHAVVYRPAVLDSTTFSHGPDLLANPRYYLWLPWSMTSEGEKPRGPLTAQ